MKLFGSSHWSECLFPNYAWQLSIFQWTVMTAGSFIHSLTHPFIHSQALTSHTRRILPTSLGSVYLSPVNIRAFPSFSNNASCLFLFFWIPVQRALLNRWSDDI